MDEARNPGWSRRRVLLAGSAGLLGACIHRSAGSTPAALTRIGSSPRSLVQVAVAPGGRIFVNYSRWFGPLPAAVAELDPRTGTFTPYPDTSFNDPLSNSAPDTRAISVQSVVVAPDGASLWIVDAGNPQMSGPIDGGAKLVQVDLATDRIVRTLRLGDDVAPAGSYLADLRIDSKRGVGYLPDLARGAIAVVDLSTGRGHRVLEGHRSTQAEDITLTFNGKPWLYPDGSRPQTAVTSMALSADGETLFFKALIGRSLYSVPVSSLAPGMPAGSAVTFAGETHPSDAIAFGPDGALYLTAIDQNAITRWRPGQRPEIVVQDERLAWPVGLTFDEQGNGYTAIGRIHEGGAYTAPCDVFRFRAGG